MEKYKRSPNTVCLVCKKSVYKRPSQIEKNKGNVFCGQKCYGMACRIEIPCIVCQKPILSGLHKKTCSRTCSNKNRAGIKYKQNKPRDIVSSQRAIKERVIKVRGNSCEDCGYNKHKILHIHHKDRNRKNNKTSNLRLLCPNCHAERHLLNK